MRCSRCHSDNVIVQIITDVESKPDRKGFLWWLLVGWWWVPIKWIFFFGVAFITKFFFAKPKRIVSKQYKTAVCQNCGKSWRI